MSPDQAQARMQAMEQQLQMLQQQLQAAAKMIEADQVKQQAMLQKAQIDAQARVQIAEMDNQTKLAVENIKAQVDRMEAMLQRTHERDTEHFKAAHEVALETMPMPPAPLEEPLQRPETI
jgi:multidrug resistance efflux pump